MRIVFPFLVVAAIWQTLCFAEGLTKQEIFVEHVKKSIAQADQGISQLNRHTLSVYGMSSDKVRHLLNNLCTLENGAYLEVGVWNGATLIAAAYQNQESLKEIVAIDHWREYSDPKSNYFTNMWLHLNCPVRTIESDSFAINLAKTFPIPINIYFYDGDHSVKAQREAFTYFNPILEDLFIAVIDDWNWPNVRQGTFEAFKELNYNVLFQQELFSRFNMDTENWWNGLLVVVLEKPKT